MSASVRKINTSARSPRDFLQLGIACSTGARGAADMVAAHKWFNLAAMHGNSEAALLRREIAAEMSQGEIAAAQRAARDWVTLH
jgi:TPR repeat protein